MKNEQLIKFFLDLVKIPSPSGQESAVADYIEAQLKDTPFKVWRDDSGKKNNCDTGNVYAYLEVNPNYPTLAFSAHMDTVQKPGEIIRPIIVGENIVSDGTTVLGADSKGSVAPLLEVARTIQPKLLNNNVLFFFPTREEAGTMGSSFFEFEKTKISYFFNLDSSDDSGVFIYKSLGYLTFEIIVEGLAAHASKHYEKGIDAIKSTGVLLTKLPLGKNIEEGWTLNIGVIEGGTNTNVVCDKVTMKGEMRAYEPAIFEKIKKEIRKICKQVSDTTKSKINLNIDKDSYIYPFIGSQTGEIIDICRDACKKVGLECVLKQSFSTSDSNFYCHKGYPVVSVSRGGSDAHSFKEAISINNLRTTVKIIESIIY